MRALKWGVGIVLLLLVAGFLHYSLPSRDIVRVIDTEVARMDVTTTDAYGEEIVRTRDVRFIEAVWPDGSPRVYRNEDTGWGWPPYLKFDSANLHAEAQSMASTAEDPKWVIVTHYGWRIPVLSMFPNALSIRPAEGPDQVLVPWVNIVLIALLVIGALVLRRFVLIGLARLRGRRSGRGA